MARIQQAVGIQNLVANRFVRFDNPWWKGQIDVEIKHLETNIAFK